MKSLVVVLSLGFAGVQSLSIEDCCCGSFCERKNACRGCGDGDACPGHGPKPSRKASCCDSGPEPAPEDRACTHFDPDGGVDLTPVRAEIVPPVEIHSIEPAAPRTVDAALACPHPPTARGRPFNHVPLPIAFSSLLI